jgi:type IV pilus assembly protein PilA
VELVVVVIIIGLLAVILIPAFLGQRNKADEGAAKALVRQGAITMEALYTDKGSYAGIDAAEAVKSEPSITFVDGPGAHARRNEVSIEDLTATTFTLRTETESGRVYSWHMDRATGVSTRDCGVDCTW